MIESHDQTRLKSRPNSESQERFQVEIKTGILTQVFFYSFYFHYEKGHTGFLGLGGSGTDAPVFIQFYDSNDQKSEIFQLKQSTRHINKFERNQTG